MFRKNTMTICWR